MDDLIYGISIEVLQEITGEELRAIKQWKKGTRKPSESAIRLINLFVHGANNSKSKVCCVIAATSVSPVQIVKRSELHTFKVMPKRWIVERSFASIIFTSKQNTKHHQIQAQASQSLLPCLAKLQVRLRRLNRFGRAVRTDYSAICANRNRWLTETGIDQSRKNN